MAGGVTLRGGVSLGRRNTPRRVVTLRGSGTHWRWLAVSHREVSRREVPEEKSSLRGGVLLRGGILRLEGRPYRWSPLF